MLNFLADHLGLVYISAYGTAGILAVWSMHEIGLFFKTEKR